MTDPEKIENDLSILRSDRDSLDEDIAAAEAELAAARGEAEPSTPDDPPTPAPVSTPNDQAALLAEIDKLEGEKKYAEAMPLKTRLLGIQSGYISTTQPTPTPADANLPTLAELRTAIDEAEANKNWSAATALKSRQLQGFFK